MRNTNKKGFTIVELVIVVAVIAILAAVLIPTFSGIIAKAQLSADKKAVHEMNTFVAMEQADTFEEALAALEKNKINTENLSPISAGYSFVWNAENNRFDLVETTEETVDIAESIKGIDVTVTTADYLAYAIANGSNTIKLDANVEVKSPLQAAAGEKITIDLNGKTLTTAERDTNGSHHYGIDVHGTVVFENGTVEARGIQIFDGGKVVIGDGATVNAVDNNGGACFWIYGGELEINGGNFNAINGSNDNDHIYEPGIISNNGGKITITAGTFTSVSSCYAINNNSGELIINGGKFVASRGVVAAVSGTVTINGGEFVVTGENPIPAHVVYASNGNVVITGGTFTNNGPEYVYCVAGEGTGSIKVDGETLTAGQAK